LCVGVGEFDAADGVPKGLLLARNVGVGARSVRAREPPQERLVGLVVDRIARRIGIAIDRRDGARERREMIDFNHTGPRQA
jgi:hypothetical protein